MPTTRVRAPTAERDQQANAIERDLSTALEFVMDRVGRWREQDALCREIRRAAEVFTICDPRRPMLNGQA